MSRIALNLGHEIFRPVTQSNILLSREVPKLTVVPVRTKYFHNRHRDQKYRLERGRKMWKPLDLPDFDHMRNQEKKSSNRLDTDEIRSKMKEKGIAPPRPYEEREVFNPCTMGIADPYKPHDGDGKSSSLVEKLKGPLTTGTEMVKSRRSLGVLRTFEGEDFELDEFAKTSLGIYKKAHELLASSDRLDNEQEIFDYVTEHCYPMMSAGINRHTIIWKYLDDIERPKVVQVRAADLVQKGNKYGQITVRFHSKQIMATYDRHGRLLMGSPTDVKDVLEYIVFEKYLANEYGLWRLHDRIRPLQTAEVRPVVVKQTRVHREQ